MSLLTLNNISLQYGGAVLLDRVSLAIGSNERIGTLGRNGAGKSTLLKVVAGLCDADSGELEWGRDTRVAYLGQEVPRKQELSVRAMVAQGLGSHGEQVLRYESAEKGALAGVKNEDLDALHHFMDHEGGWSVKAKIDEVVSRLELDSEVSFSGLSAGLKRRTLLGKALVSDPNLLLLDEPTNHLDMEAILWLEGFLKKFSGSLLFVTHDRVFLQNLATSILDLDRGILTRWDCNYPTYLSRKEEVLVAEEKSQAAFDKKLAQEEKWIRQGIQARRTRNEGRVRALKKMREERRARRNRQGLAKLQTQAATPSGVKVIEAKKITYRYSDMPLVDGLSFTLRRGDKVGVVGPNGAGKTTLIRLLLKEIEPESGAVEHGTQLSIAYFDQLRRGLDELATVFDNVGEGRDQVLVNGRSRHVMSYLQDFLFSPDRARSPVSMLSGGEKNRLLLAKLFTRQSNLLVLDEPTNDLDTETLELLEECLLDYPGSILFVSHDRSFLNNIATSLLVFEQSGQVRECIGGYDDWLSEQIAVSSEPLADTKSSVKKNEKPRTLAKRKLSFKEKKELEGLPTTIEALELEQSSLLEFLSNPSDDALALKEKAERLARLETELEQAYARWQELELIASCEV